MLMHVLIVEDEPLALQSMVDLVRRMGGKPVVATSVWAARHALTGRPDWTAFVLDTELPDGSGLDVLVYARKSHSRTPAMVLVGLLETGLVNKVFDFGGVCVEKPYEPMRLERFLRDTLERNAGSTDPIDGVIQDWELRCHFSAADVDVLRKTVAGETCAWIADSRGTTISTIKSQWRHIREKTGEPTMVSVVNRLLREASFGERKRA
jgi:DNA-binding response OmpR family regulator